jgi:small subunit ribosomal protein S20
LATHASALKRARQGEKRRQHNVSVRSTLKTYFKKVLQAVESKDPQEAKKALGCAIPALQRASSKRVIPKKNAYRKISRLAKKVDRLTSPA